MRYRNEQCLKEHRWALFGIAVGLHAAFILWLVSVAVWNRRVSTAHTLVASLLAWTTLVSFLHFRACLVTRLERAFAPVSWTLVDGPLYVLGIERSASSRRAFTLLTQLALVLCLTVRTLNRLVTQTVPS
jgi:hypothetical protein